MTGIDNSTLQDIGTRLTTLIAQALDDDVLNEEDTAIVSQDVLDHLNKVHTSEELLAYLSELVEEWPFLEPVYRLEMAKQEESTVQAQASDITRQLQQI